MSCIVQSVLYNILHTAMLLLGSRLVGWKVRVPSVQICLECGTVVVVVVVVVGGGEDCTVLCLYPGGCTASLGSSSHATTKYKLCLLPV